MVSPTHSVSILRTHLLNALSTLPGRRIFDINVLVSSPRKPNESLFPYAPSKPKSLMQEVLILLSERIPASDAENMSSQGVFVTAIEADIFFFPASSSTILYVSKVDGTGQGTYPSPTSTLVHAFLQFYASPSSPIYPENQSHTLWIHLFARAQRQYLFPNSGDHPYKKPLGDVALCKWWKNSLARAAADALKAHEALDSIQKEHLELSVRLFYLLPGQSELEATYSLGLGNSTSPCPQWTYSHPYGVHKDLDIPSVSASSNLESQEHHLPSLIPYFDDDPKSRFLDELAATSEEMTIAVPTPTPKRKKRRLNCDLSNHTQQNSTTAISAYEPPSNFTSQSIHIQMPRPERPSPPSIAFIPATSSPPRCDADEPVARPSTPEPTLQKEILDVPQTPRFLVLPAQLLSPHTPSTGRLHPSVTEPQLTPPPNPPRTPHTPKPSRRPKSDLDTVTTTEFWERMSFRQECAQGAVTGFFVAVLSQKSLSNSKFVDTSETAPSILFTGTVPHTAIKRIMSSLLTGVEFSSTERSYKATHVIETAIKGLCDGIRDPSLPTAREGKDDSVSLYSGHVHASITLDNPPISRQSLSDLSTTIGNGGQPVNVLGVRRKKKRDQ